MRRSWIPLLVSVLLIGVAAVPRETHTSSVPDRHFVASFAVEKSEKAQVNPCPFGRHLDRRECVQVGRFVRRWALARYFAWVWDNPPSPGFRSWDCVGIAETGNRYGAHGSKYSSAFGMLNAAVRERADDPESAARIMAGTASPGEERRAAWRELLTFGPGAWAYRTVATCEV